MDNTGKSKIDSRILGVDLFVMLGLEGMTSEEKSKYTDDFTKILTTYFMGVKIPKYLDEEQMDKFAQKYPELNNETFQSFLDELAQVVPDTGELFSDALVETRFRVVRDQYEGIKKELETKLASTEDQTEKDKLVAKMDKCDLNLQYLDSGDYDKINYNVEQ